MPVATLVAADLNTAVPAQTAYLQAGGIPTSASGLSLTQPATWAVLLPGSGAPPVAVAVAATSVPCGTGSTNQDNYVDLTPLGAYVVTSGAVGFTPSAPAAGNLRLYKVTTTSANTAVSFPVTTLAPSAPRVPPALGTDGSGAASTVTLGGNLAAGTQTNTSAGAQILPGITTLSDDLLLGGLLRHGATPGGTTPNSISFVPGAAGIALTGLAVATGPGGVTAFTTPSTITGSAPYQVVTAIANYHLGTTNPFLPSGYRAQPPLVGFLLSEIASQTTQPGLWVGAITPVSVTPPDGDGPNPQTWYEVAIWASALSPSTTYSFAYLPLFA